MSWGGKTSAPPHDASTIDITMAVVLVLCAILAAALAVTNKLKMRRADDSSERIYEKGMAVENEVENPTLPR